MFRRIPRWSWLAILAACNLVFWIAVAVGVGLLASDAVDVGLESTLRQYRVTAAAVWDQAPATNPSPTVRPTTGTHPTAQVEEATTIQPGPTNTPPAARTRRPTSETATGEPGPGPAMPTVGTAENLFSGPLLLSDPDLPTLELIESEMARSAAERPVQIRYQEEALNREVQALLDQYPDTPYENLQVDLQRDGLVLNGSVVVMGFEVETKVTGTVYVQDCRPQAEIETISLAGLSTPGIVRETIREFVEEALGWYPADYPLCLEQIVLEEERVTIYGSRR